MLLIADALGYVLADLQNLLGRTRFFTQEEAQTDFEGFELSAGWGFNEKIERFPGVAGGGGGDEEFGDPLVGFLVLRVYLEQ